MNRLMVDLETLDVRPTSVVASLGAVVFDENEVMGNEAGRIYYRFTWQDQLDAGRTVSEKALMFWLTESAEARRELIAEPRTTLHVGIRALQHLWQTFNCRQLWCCGPDFDFAILQHAAGYNLLGDAYDAPRDVRAIRDLVPTEWIEEANRGRVKHQPLSDAFAQAKLISRALRRFGSLI